MYIVTVYQTYILVQLLCQNLYSKRALRTGFNVKSCTILDGLHTGFVKHRRAGSYVQCIQIKFKIREQSGERNVQKEIRKRRESHGKQTK